MIRMRNKEYKYLYRKMLEDNIIIEAYKKLRKGKTKRKSIRYIDAHFEEEVYKMKTMIYYTRKEFENTEYDMLSFHSTSVKPKFILEHGKQRKIYMPEIHEQWLHHIIILIIEKIILNRSYQYSCGSFPGRGAHYGKKYLEKKIKNNPDLYCFKADIRHFYNNIRKKTLINYLRYFIKDEWFIYVIERCLNNFKKGLPLGYYISQWFANYFLESFDFLSLAYKPNVYIRYMDDIVVCDKDKSKLHMMKNKLTKYLCKYKKLKFKNNYQIFKITNDKAVDFMGFKFYSNRTTLRKNIIINSIRLVKRLMKAKRYFLKHIRALLSYTGWYKYSNTKTIFYNNIVKNINLNKLRHIISKYDKRRLYYYDRVDYGIQYRAA